MRRHALIVAVLLLVAATASAQSFSYPTFSSTTGLTLNGDATASSDELWLTTTSDQVGTAFRAVELPADGTFSTFFSFRLDNGSGGDDACTGADGITFTVQTDGISAVGGGGGDLGYGGISPSVAVEIDTYSGGTDVNGNHIGIDTNGSLDSLAQTAIGPCLNNGGTIWYAWVDYDGTTDLLEVRLSTAPVRPGSATLTQVVDIPTILGSANVYVGFTGGTGAFSNRQSILSWYFNEAVAAEVPTAGFWGLLAMLTVLGAVAILRLR